MKLTINLLPNEFALKSKEQAKFNLVQTISILAVLVIILLASGVVALNITQNKKISNLESSIKQSEDDIKSFKDKEISLSVLKDRLATINKLSKVPSKQIAAYRFITQLLPGNLFISSLSSDKTGSVILSALVPDYPTLEQTMTVLTDQAAFNTVSKVDVESLSRSKDGVYRLNLKLTMK